MTKLAMVHSKYIGTGNGAYKPKQSLSGITLYIYIHMYIYNPFPPKKKYIPPFLDGFDFYICLLVYHTKTFMYILKTVHINIYIYMYINILYIYMHTHTHLKS